MDERLERLPEERFLAAFFDFLNSEAVEYSVIRNYETLPQTVLGTDIDLVIRQKEFKRVCRRFHDVAAGAGYRVWKKFPKNWNIMHLKFAPVNCTDPKDVVKIDFMLNGLKWLGYDLLDRKTLLNHIVEHNGVRVLEKPASTLLTLLNSWTYGGRLKEKYRQEYLGLPADGRLWVDQKLTEAFGSYAAVLIGLLEAGENDFNFNRLRLAFVLQRKTEWFHLLAGAVSFISSTLRRIVSPPGEFVCVTGPDGCGKSSLVNSVETTCERMYKRLLRFHHFPLLRIFSRIDRVSTVRYERRLSNADEWSNRNRKNGVLISLLRCSYQLFRLWAGYWFWIWPERVKGSLVIGERWCYDWLLDPGSKGVTLPYGIRKCFFMLCPKPDKLVVMRCSPALARKRKPELPEEEISRQYELIDRLLSHERGFCYVDNNGSLQETAGAFTSVLCR